MTWTDVADAAAAACLVLGALLTLIAGIGILRFPDVLTRMHSATKPQVLGLLVIVLGLGLRLRDPAAIGHEIIKAKGINPPQNCSGCHR